MYKLNYGENVLTHQKREMLAMTLRTYSAKGSRKTMNTQEKKPFVCPGCKLRPHIEFGESAIKQHVWLEHGKAVYEDFFGPAPFIAEVKPEGGMV